MCYQVQVIQVSILGQIITSALLLVQVHYRLLAGIFISRVGQVKLHINQLLYEIVMVLLIVQVVHHAIGHFGLDYFILWAIYIFRFSVC